MGETPQHEVGRVGREGEREEAQQVHARHRPGGEREGHGEQPEQRHAGVLREVHAVRIVEQRRREEVLAVQQRVRRVLEEPRRLDDVLTEQRGHAARIARVDGNIRKNADDRVGVQRERVSVRTRKRSGARRTAIAWRCSRRPSGGRRDRDLGRGSRRRYAADGAVSSGHGDGVAAGGGGVVAHNGAHGSDSPRRRGGRKSTRPSGTLVSGKAYPRQVRRIDSQSGISLSPVWPDARAGRASEGETGSESEASRLSRYGWLRQPACYVLNSGPRQASVPVAEVR